MRRTDLLTSALDTANLVEHSASVGEQDYMLDAGATLSSSETEIYVKAKSPAQLAELSEQLSATLKEHYRVVNHHANRENQSRQRDDVD